MWKQFLLVLALSGAIAPAQAIDYTDIWWVPTESGWGVNFVQSDNLIFATMFVYGPDGAPTWVIAQMTRTPTGVFFGPVFATTGPYYGAPAFKTSLSTEQQVGTATFHPTGPANGELNYSVSTVFVSKLIQRQNLAAAALDGAYLGGTKTLLTGCDFPEQNGVTYNAALIFVDRFAPGQIQLELVSDGGLLCKVAGTLEQQGTLNGVTEAIYTCNDGLATTATLSELKRTSLGIEGRLVARIPQAECQQEVTFAAVLK